MLYVTHDQLEAMTLADRIGILSHGRLVQIADPRTVYEAPATVTAAMRLGSPAINLVSPGALGLTGAPAGATRAGVRPEDVRLGTGGVMGEIINVEHLGAETVALVRTADVTLHALLTADRPVAEGAATTVAVRPGAPIWFDSAERRIA
ncbi:MAG: hypothetical protein AcusKO_03940 [Acuticoccus sp.]